MADQTPREFKLNTGASIPAVGLGTWKAEKGVVGEALTNAVKVGYRHIDCAYIYGNQKEIGKALHNLFETNVVQRKDLWITSKLWNTDHDPEDVPKALERTLADLQLDYLDLYLIHWPLSVKKGTKNEGLAPEPDDFAPLDLVSTWHAMESLLQTKKVRAIGVSNFSMKKLDDLLSHAKVVPAVNQVECNPKWQQARLREYCKAKGIHLSAYSPLGSSGNPVLQEPVIKQLAQRLGKTPAQVALRWGIQVGMSVLPKSTSAEHLKYNIDVFDWSIPEHEFSQLANIDQVRQVWGKEWINSKGSPYKSYEDLWDENA